MNHDFEDRLFEDIIEPDLPIVDAHHHLWFLPNHVLAFLQQDNSIAGQNYQEISRRAPRYLLDEFLADIQSGHNVIASVYVDCHSMYKKDGAQHLKSVGEVEFANGIAAVAASGTFTNVELCKGIVGGIDLCLGEAVQEVLEAHICAGGSRYRGVRCGSMTAYDEDFTIIGPRRAELLYNRNFRAGLACLEKYGLTFDLFILEPQLPDALALARMFPQIPIVINHIGTPIGVGTYSGKRQDRYPIWRENMRALADCGNVYVKLGGLGQPFAGFATFSTQASSEQLAEEWRPYIEYCIEAFGPSRCMFESNFPVDGRTCSYPVLWNAFKRLTSGASTAEKQLLFSGTASTFYHLT